MIAVALLSIGVVAAAMAAMAVGLLVSGRCLRGSCGALETQDPDRQLLRCAACPRRPSHQSRDGRGFAGSGRTRPEVEA